MKVQFYTKTNSLQYVKANAGKNNKIDKSVSSYAEWFFSSLKTALVSAGSIAKEVVSLCYYSLIAFATGILTALRIEVERIALIIRPLFVKSNQLAVDRECAPVY